MRRWIKQGRLPAALQDGWFGPTYRVPAAAVEVFARRRARLLGETRAVEMLTYQELLAIAEQPATRMAFLGWSRTAPSVTPGAVLRWLQTWLAEGSSSGVQPVPGYPSRFVKAPPDP